jgi:quercetin dioxygenase-like cupin family protein
MRFLEKSHDGGKDSGVTGYFLIEIKSLFSIVLIRFRPGSREAYHNHAFNALTIWLNGKVKEYYLDGTVGNWHAGQFKWTPRTCFHKIDAQGTAWAISFRGPWKKYWNESRKGDIVTLTHGRIEVNK